MKAPAIQSPTAADVAELVRARARAEWAEWNAIAAHVEAEEARIEAEQSRPLMRQAELSMVPLDLGLALHWSEGQVSHRAAQARRVRDKTPMVWDAFRRGRIDGWKAREISSAIEKLERPTSIFRLDAQVVAYAERHTVAELRRWLKIFIARVESELMAERAKAQRSNRRVVIEHGNDGMSWLMLYQPSFLVAAIDKRATKEAKAFGADDPRTMEQRRADLLAAWMTTNEAREAALNADIAVTMPGYAVAGSKEAPAVAADGSWVAPSQWMLDLARHDANNLFWHRMILDPITDDVLAHEYLGRYAPKILAKVLEFRDGVCQAPGCCRPAHLCDLDHRVPYEMGGPTSAANMGPLSRRHHGAKGLGVLNWGWNPTSPAPPGHSLKTPLHSVGDFVFPEYKLQRLIREHAA